jgi:hypothetical protein
MQDSRNTILVYRNQHQIFSGQMYLTIPFKQKFTKRWGKNIEMIQTNRKNSLQGTRKKGWTKKKRKRTLIVKNEYIMKYHRQSQKWVNFLERMKHKATLRFGTWNIKSLYMTDSLKQQSVSWILGGRLVVKWEKGSTATATKINICLAQNI